MKIRIKFSRQGPMKFIGHLDILRYFQKVMRRADVDICYSEGFSPHQIMSFAAPLGVGITSNGEYVDIEVSSTGTSREMIDRLNREMAQGMEVLSYRLLPDGAGNAMSIVAAADYTVSFRPGYEPANPAGWAAGLIGFYRQDSVYITKKTKRGEKRMDLRPLIYGLEQRGAAVFMRISTGSAANIKPELVLDAYYGAEGLERPPFAHVIQREEVYADLADGEEKEKGIHRFVPLEKLGEDIHSIG